MLIMDYLMAHNGFNDVICDIDLSAAQKISHRVYFIAFLAVLIFY